MILTTLAVLIVALVVLAAMSRLVPRGAAAMASGGACGVAMVLAVVSLATGPAAMQLPRLALDPLAASFVLVLFLAMPCTAAPPLRTAGTAVVLLAGDAITLAVGVLMLGSRRAVRPATVATACLVVALGLAAPIGDFAVIRGAPPEGLRAAAVLVLTLCGVGSLSRIDPALAMYLVLRVLLDLCGAVQPGWWGLPLLLGGAAVAVAGTLRAALAGTTYAVVTNLSLGQAGIAASSIGVALLAHGVDLPSTTAHALDAAWLAVTSHVIGGALLLRCAEAAEAGAGTRRLDRLGGLIHRMPATAASCLSGVFAVAILPPGLGFAAFWLLFQSLLAAARFGGFGLQLLVVCVATAMAAAAGAAALAAVRLFGVAFLGVPRSPRAAVAEEMRRPARLVSTGLAVLAALLGVLPGLALLPASQWTHTPPLAQLPALRIGAETPGYWPIAVALLLVVGIVALLRGLPRPAGKARAPAWAGGFAAPPSWLPFGDPAAQCGPAAFVGPLRELVRRLPSRHAARAAVMRLTARVMR